MWTQLSTLTTILLLSTTANAFPRFRGKHFQHRPRPNGGEAITTITVNPMPVGTYDGIYYSGVPTGFPTATDVASGVFPLGVTGVVPSGSGTGVPFPTFTGPPVIVISSGTEEDTPETIFPTVTDVASGIFPPGFPTGSGTGFLPSGTGVFPSGTGFPGSSGGFPVFTGVPTAILPSETAASSSATAITSIDFPIFTRPAIISMPSGTEVVVAPTPAPVFTSTPTLIASLSDVSSFTNAPVINIPTGTAAVVAPVQSTTRTRTRTRSRSTTSTVASAPVVTAPVASLSKFPKFTKAPIISVPSGTGVVVAPAASATPSSASASLTLSATAPAMTWPIFTGKPIIDVPAI